MKLLCSLVVAIALSAGLVFALSAYLAPLDLADERLVGLTSMTTIVSPEDRKAVLIAKGETVDEAALARLRDAGVSRLRVEEFSFGRWRESWLFLAAAAALGAAGVFGKRLARAEATGAAAPSASGSATARHDSAAGIIDEIDRAVARLLAEWPAAAEAQCERTLETLGPLIEERVPALVALRPALVAERGMGGYAAILDRFAAAERQLNRAWSAAADAVPEESHECLLLARQLLAETRATLEAGSPRR